MGRHDSCQLLAQPGKRYEIMGTDLLKTALIRRDGYMRISFSPPMPRKMLTGGSHARVVHPANKCPGQNSGALGHDPATLLGQVFGIGVVGNRAHGGQAHKALAQALHPAAFLVHRQQQVRAHGAN